MSASMNTHVVPWACREEFDAVYRKLYSGNNFQRRDGVNHVTAWQARCLSHLAVSITCTADLVMAQLAHQSHFDRTSQCNEYHLRQSIALAIIRFVNFITDRYQTDKSNVAIPIHRIGHEIGIPDWIVSLRHEGTHRELPTLDVLVRGIEWGVKWLKVNFWERQLAAACTAQSKDKSPVRRLNASRESVVEDVLMDSSGTTLAHTESHITICRLIVAFQQIRFQELAGKVFKASDLDTGPEGREVVEELKKTLSFNVENSISTLLEPGFLIPTHSQLSHLGVSPDEPNTKRLARVLTIFWCPVLREINSLRLTGTLLERLVSQVTSQMSLSNRLVHVWLGILVARYTVTFPSRKPVRLFKHQPVVNELSLLQHCLHHPCVYTTELLAVCASCDNSLLTAESLKKLCTLVDLYTAERTSGTEAVDMDNSPSSDIMFTVLDLKNECSERVSPERANKSRDESRNEQGWTLCTDPVSWQDVPVGLLPGQNLSSLSRQFDQNHHAWTGQESGSLNAQLRVSLEDSIMDTGLLDIGGETTSKYCTFSWSSGQLDSIRHKLAVL